MEKKTEKGEKAEWKIIKLSLWIFRRNFGDRAKRKKSIGWI